MKKIKVDGKIIELDDEGFLVDSDDWNYQVAQVMANNLGMGELDNELVEVIQFLRGYYKNYQEFPLLNYVCKYVETPLEYLNQQFVNPMNVWKIAGLPKQDNIQFVTADDKFYHLGESC